MRWNERERLLPVFAVTCGKRWEELDAVPGAEDRRHCRDCARPVFRVESEEAFETLRSSGQCVNVPVAPGAPPGLDVPIGGAPMPRLPIDQKKEAARLARNDRMWMVVGVFVASALAAIAGLAAWVLWTVLRALLGS